MSINSLLVQTSTDPTYKSIVDKVMENQRINDDDCKYLFDEASLSEVGILANEVRKRKSGDKVFFNHNFHIEPTNVCVYSCKFCSYSRLIKQRADGWELTLEQMFDLVTKYDDHDVTEVHIVGGVMPQYDLKFYMDLFQKIKAHRPELHIKALTPVEYFYIFKKAKVSYIDGFKLLKESGLDSIPGGGAEIFDPEIRTIIASDKCTGEQWLDLHRAWHSLGGRSNATILYGHIEKTKHRIDHLSKLRSLQDETGGFQTFIPLKFLNENNEMSHISMTSVVDDMKMYAVSRIYLDNFDHLKAYWPMLGRTLAQMSLQFGVDDLDGTIDDTTKIYSMAGSEELNPAMTTQELVQLIMNSGRVPIQRDTYYNEVRNYIIDQLDIDPTQQYFPLQVINN